MEFAGNANGRLTVVLADEDPLVCRALREALAGEGIAVVAEAATGADAVRLTRRHEPDILLIDLELPGADPREVIRHARAASAGTAVLVLTTTRDDDTAVALLRAGASGFLTKDVAMEHLPRAVRAAAGGEAAVSRQLVGTLLARLRDLPEGEPGVRPVKSALTPREWEVLDMLSAGQSAEQVAAELVLSPETVRSHIKNILRKTGSHSRQEAIAMTEQLRRPSRAAER